MKFFFTLDAPYHWTLVNPKGEVVDRGVVEALIQLEIPRTAQVIGIAPGDSITLRQTVLPGKRRATALAAMPYALEESLSEDVEALHFTLVDWQPDQPATVAIVARMQLAEWLASCMAADIALDRIVPGYLLLPRHNDQSVTVSPLAGDGSDSVYVRSGAMAGFAVDRSYLDYWLDVDTDSGQSLSVTDRELAQSISQRDGLNVSFWDIGLTTDAWIAAGGHQSIPEGLSLLHGDFVPAHRARSYRPLRIAAVCALLGVVVYYGSMLVETNRLQATQQALNSEMRQLFSRSFPDQPWLGRPKTQVEALLAGADGDADRHQFQRLLKAVTRVAQQHRANIEEVNFRDRSLTVLCQVSGLSVLDDIRSALQALPGMSAELLSSGASDSQVTGRFRLRAG